MLLNGVIGEVYFRFEVVDVEVVGRGADVALFVPIGPRHSVEVGDEQVVSDVEFAVIVEEGSVDVHLHDVGSLGSGLVLAFAGFVGLFDDIVEFVDFVDDSDSSTLV
jgi:hypothetical protein